MKLIVTIVCILICIVSFGQPNKLKVGSFYDNGKPEIYVDSIRTEFEYFNLDPSEIKSVDVIKNKNLQMSNVPNKIFIATKNPEKYHFLSFNQLKEKYFASTSKPVLLLVNSVFIRNLKTINIEFDYIFKVDVENGSDFDELKNIYPLLSIVNIKTKIKPELIGEKQITLDGMPKNMEPQ